MAAEREEETFKVTDRRRRSDDDEPSTPAPEPRGTEPRARVVEPAEPPRPAPSRPAVEPAGQPQRDLTGLFLMLASSALVAMGEAPHPQGGPVEVDLEAAAEAIDMLILLREKTEGHRTREEEQLLGHILYDLQLRFVEARRLPRS